MPCLTRLTDLHQKFAKEGNAYTFTGRRVSVVMMFLRPTETLILNLEKDDDHLATTLVMSRLLIGENRILGSGRHTKEHSVWQNPSQFDLIKTVLLKFCF